VDAAARRHSRATGRSHHALRCGDIRPVCLLIGLWNVPGEWHSAYLMLVALNLIFLAIPAGRFLGTDQFLLPLLVPAAARGNPLARLLVRLM
jgi:hypothetical protein